MADFLQLRQLFAMSAVGKSKPDRDVAVDATEAGPLGRLWHKGPPEWYVRRRQRLDAELARIAANLTANSKAVPQSP
jgi:hypothetical protein